MVVLQTEKEQGFKNYIAHDEYDHAWKRKYLSEKLIVTHNHKMQWMRKMSEKSVPVEDFKIFSFEKSFEPWATLQG